MKIRIFALAKELGLDSKDLIESAAEAGVEVKNSALASISHEERDQILSYLKSRESGGGRGASPTEEVVATRRETADDRRKVRAIESGTRPTRAARDEDRTATRGGHEVSAHDQSDVGDTSSEGEREDMVAATGTAIAEPQEDDTVTGAGIAEVEDATADEEVETPLADGATATETGEQSGEKSSLDSDAGLETPKTPERTASGAALERTGPVRAAAKPAELKTGRPPQIKGSVPTAKSGSEPKRVEKSKPIEKLADKPAVTGEVRPDRTDEMAGEEVGKGTSTPTSPSDASPIRPMAPRAGESVAPRRMGSPRDMRPVGTVQTNAQRSPKKDTREREKKRPQMAHPAIAAPPKLPPTRPKAVPDEAPAQKPDMPLKPSMIKDRSSPLSAHLASRAGEKKGGAGAGRRGGAKGGGEGFISEIDRDQAGLKSKRRGRPGRRSRDDDDDGPRGRTLHRNRSRRGAVEYTSSATVETPITIRSLSEAMGRPAKQLLTVVFKQGMMISINDVIDEDTAEEIAIELGVELTIKRDRDLEAELAAMLESDPDEPELITRPPVVTILGHVDHGKTTLLDTIRKSNVASGEVGGITQHIAAYQIEHNGKKITFVDTPGHAAFGEMRARGANVTDVVVLVVASDDGVMPQTEESISHARAAGVPMIVALNKMDAPGADEARVLQGLAARNVLPAEWGGDTEVIRTAGATGMGIEELLDTIQITTELSELKANPERPAVGVCLEAFRDEGRGPLAWVIVQKGTLRVGDIVLCGAAYGRVRAMYDDRDQEVTEAPPSTPVLMAGLESVPSSGSHFFVMNSLDDARDLAEDRGRLGRAETLASLVQRPRSFEEILETARTGEVQDLPLIIKADTGGSIEAIKHELDKFEHPEVRVRMLHTGVGGVNESDVSLASASGAIIVAFQVVADDRAQALADREGVEIRRYKIIYEVMESIRQNLEGLLKPEQREVMTGRAIVLQTFKISRSGTIAGCRVLNGTIERNNRVHLIRQQTLVNTMGIGSLRREKEDVREVREGMECGIRLDGFNDIKEGDLLEAFRIEQIKRTLE